MGLDPCLLFATFETMLSQLRSTGEINISSFSKHLSSRHDLALSSVDQYVYLHDTVAAAIECGHLHGVIQIRNGNNFGGKFKLIICAYYTYFNFDTYFCRYSDAQWNHRLRGPDVGI